MNDPTFVRGWHEYQSYTDYWRLVELAGFPVCRLDEMNASDPERIYIVTPLNGETQPGWPDARARIVLWDLEWHQPYEPPPGVAEVWASDAWHASFINARFVPLGSHRDLVRAKNQGRDMRWDVCLLAYRSPRRQALVAELRRRGLTIAPDGWGRERERTLLHSRVMVHVHQHAEFPCVAAQRFALAASAHVPLVAEACADPEPWRPSVDFISAPYSMLPDAVAFWAQKPGRSVMATAAFDRMCNNLHFARNVRAACMTMREVA